MLRVQANLYSLNIGVEQLTGLIQLLNNHNKFRPDKWGAYEPLTHDFSDIDIQKVIQEWDARAATLLFIKYTSNWKLEMMLIKNLRKPHSFWLSIDEPFFYDEYSLDIFLDFVIDVFVRCNILYGYACHKQEFERKNKLPQLTRIDGKLIGTGGMNITKCLPGVYWANFFGRFYVKWFGAECVDAAPAYHLGMLPNDGRYIVTAPSPLEKNQEKELLEEKIRNHLGAQAFFDINNPTKSCISPFKDGTIRFT